MELKRITVEDNDWNAVAEYAYNCSWCAGKKLAKEMYDCNFNDWERVIIAKEQEHIIGYCIVTKKCCIPDTAYTPNIGFLFVDEKCRGKRLSQMLINDAMEYLHELGFKEAYLVSDHINLYEKYGFRVVDRKMAPWGAEEKIYMQELR